MATKDKTIWLEDGNELAQLMYTYLNEWEDKPCTIEVEAYASAEPSGMMLQQLQRAKAIKHYVNGYYVGAWSFAIYLVVSELDTLSRLAATACLNKLDEWMTQKDEQKNYTNLPSLGDNRVARRITMTGSPTLLERDNTGNAIFQAIFELEYAGSQ